jgi:hypothetical protein
MMIKAKREINKALKAISKRQILYLCGIKKGLESKEINNMSKQIMELYNKKYGQCFVGKIGKLSSNEAVLKKYKSGKQYDFNCEFVIPKYDSKLVEMIEECNNNYFKKRPIEEIKVFSTEAEAKADVTAFLKSLDRIHKRISKLKGIIILWPSKWLYADLGFNQSEN